VNKIKYIPALRLWKSKKDKEKKKKRRRKAIKLKRTHLILQMLQTPKINILMFNQKR